MTFWARKIERRPALVTYSSPVRSKTTTLTAEASTASSASSSAPTLSLSRRPSRTSVLVRERPSWTRTSRDMGFLAQAPCAQPGLWHVTVWSAQSLLQGEHVLRAAAGVLGGIHQSQRQVDAQPADGSLSALSREHAWRRSERIEGPAVVRELEGHLVGDEREPEPDPVFARRRRARGARRWSGPPRPRGADPGRSPRECTRSGGRPRGRRGLGPAPASRPGTAFPPVLAPQGRTGVDGTTTISRLRSSRRAQRATSWSRETVTSRVAISRFS